MKKALFILVVLTLLVSACGSDLVPTEEAAPELTGEDVQATAMSMAWTMAAQTQAAIPTATFTPVPPTATFTPVFTETPIASATPFATATSLPTATTEGDVCNKILSGWEGKESKLLLQNETKNDVSVSIYMYDNPTHDNCGYISAFLSGKSSATLTIPIGFYSVYVIAQDGSNYNKYQDLGGILNPDKHTIFIRKEGLKYVWP